MRVFPGILAIVITITGFVSGAQSESEIEATSQATGVTYFGQIPPGEIAEPFAPDVLVHEAHDSPVISPDEKWILYQGMGTGVEFYGIVDGHLTTIENPTGIEFPFPCNGVAASPSGDRLYIEEWKDGHGYIYHIDKKGDQWTLPTYFNLPGTDNWWQISISSSGSLYFSTSGKVMVSFLDGDSHLEPLPLKLENDNDMTGDTPYISPDERYLIYSVDGDLHISYHRNDGKWTLPVNLGHNINSDQVDLCPQITPNGKYLLFTTRRNHLRFNIYWANASFVENLRPKE